MLCGAVSAYADNPVFTPEYPDFSGLSTVLATCTREEVLYRCTHVTKLHFFYLEASISQLATSIQRGCLLFSAANILNSQRTSSGTEYGRRSFINAFDYMLSVFKEVLAGFSRSETWNF